MSVVRGLLSTFTFLLTALLLVGCEPSKALPEPPAIQKLSSAKPLVIGILPETNVFEQRKRYRPLGEYLAHVLERPVKIKLLDSYSSTGIAQEIEHDLIDAAFFGSFIYTLTRQQGIIEPIARPVDSTYGADYRGVIFTRPNTGITDDVATWSGRRIALVHHANTAGYLFPRWYLHRSYHGDYHAYFERMLFLGSHDAVVLAVASGHADIGAAKESVVAQMMLEKPEIAKNITLLAHSDTLTAPNNCLAVRHDLAPEIKEALANALLGMHDSELGRAALRALGADKFIPTEDHEYDTLRYIIQELNLFDQNLEKIDPAGRP